MALDAADHADIMKLSLEERVAQRVKDVKTMTKRPYAPAADPLPPKSSENRFAAPTNSFSIGNAERPRRRKPRARATNDLNDVWASLDKLNEADDFDALDGVTLDEDLSAAFDAAAKISDDEYDAPELTAPVETSFAELAVEKLEFGVSLLPEASLENAGPYRDQEPLLESSDESSEEDDAPPEIDEVLEEEREEAEAFRNRRLGEAPPVVARGKGKLKAKASPTCVADFADLESGETLDITKLEEACEKEIVYPRNPNRMQDDEATKRGEAIAKHYRAQMERKQAKEQRRRNRAMRGRVLGEDEADTSSSEDDGALREPIPPGAFDHGGSTAEPRRSPFPAWDESKNVAENLDACLARLRVAAPLNDADVAGSAAAAALAELPDDMPGEGAFNPALGALADGGGAFAD
mgnify:FL=1